MKCVNCEDDIPPAAAFCIECGLETDGRLPSPVQIFIPPGLSALALAEYLAEAADAAWDGCD